GRNIRGQRSRNHARRSKRTNLARVDRRTCSDEPAAVCAHVTDFGHHPPGKLPLDGEVPLLCVGSNEVALGKEAKSAQRRTAWTIKDRSSVVEKRRQAWNPGDGRQWEVRVWPLTRKRILRCHREWRRTEILGEW